MSEKKLRASLATMEKALEKNESQKFWEARKRCLPLFGEGTHPAVRAKLWGEFRDLSKRARGGADS